jgi:hypothetical protein
MLGKLAAADPGIGVHPMGHNFGARLVAYSLSGLPLAASGAKNPVKTLYLIQGAFSHSRSRTRCGPGAGVHRVPTHRGSLGG